MKLSEQVFENKWVRLDTIQPSQQTREFIKASGAVEAMWQWLPRLPGRGTTYEAYYDHVVDQMKRGYMLPFFARNKADGAFAGGASYVDVSRTHRSVRIGSIWTPPDLRGTPLTLATQAAMIQGAINWRAKRLTWVVDTLNTRQMVLVEKKIGAHKEGVLRNVARINDGRWCNSAVFSLVGDEMSQAVARMETQLEIDFSQSD